MWIAIAAVSLVLAAAVVGWRLAAAGKSAPDENSRERQHEVPGAHGRPPTLPD